MEDVNRIKLVLVEKKRTSKWLAEQLGVNPSIKELFVREYKQYLLSQESKKNE